MRKNRPIKLIRKRDAQADATTSGEPAARTTGASSERDIKNVVSRWVRDHRQRTEEFQRTFATLWNAGEFHLPTR